MGNTGSSSIRRDQAMSSTHDAFSIPNHSPTLANNETLFSDTATPSNEYSYPPRTPRHDDLSPQPGSAGSGSILPLHSTSGRHPYPPVHQSWARIQSWLSRNFPELGDTLNYGILPEDLQQLQMQFGFPLPPTIRDSYLRVDGQELESSAGCSEGLFFGLSLLSLEEVLDEWKLWRRVDEDPETGGNPKLQARMKSIPNGWVRTDYSNRGWLPLVSDRVGNYLGVDINPGEKGVAGQVIVFGRDFDTKVVLWRGDGEGGWAKFLAHFVDELETGDTFEVGNQESNSEGSEDSIGHDTYFFDGSAQGNRGEGGGNGGAVGLRLTGEYRGWNVLEALADRSVKKWKEAGIVAEEDFPTVDSRKISGLVGLQPLQQDTGVEVPIPLIDDTTSSSLEPIASTSTNKPLPLEPPTPRAPTHKPTKSSISRPAPLPIELPTPSDIAADTASLYDSEVQPGDEQDLERGNRMPLRTLEPRPDLQNGELPLRSAFSPRMSDEDTRLLKQITVEPPTPVTTDAAGELVTLPHKRKTPSPTPEEGEEEEGEEEEEEDEDEDEDEDEEEDDDDDEDDDEDEDDEEEEEKEVDLLHDSAPGGLQPPSLSVKTAMRKDGSGGTSPGSATGSGVSSPYFTPLDSAAPTPAPSTGAGPSKTGKAS